MVYLKLKVFSLLIHAVYESIDHCNTTTTTDNNNKNYDYLCNFFSLIIGTSIPQKIIKKSHFVVHIYMFLYKIYN